MNSKQRKAVTPVCYRTLDDIAQALSGKNVPGHVLRCVTKFLAPRVIFDESSADQASSIIILTNSALKGDSGVTRIRAHLHVSPRIRELPLIKRTGAFSPWMPGHQLGFDDHVTDPDLQRTGCLALMDLTGLEEALVFFLRAVSLIQSVPSNDARFTKWKIIGAVKQAQEITRGMGMDILGNASALQDAISLALVNWDADPKEILPILNRAINAFRGYGGWNVPKKAKPRLTALAKFCKENPHPFVMDPIATASDLLAAFLCNMEHSHRQAGHLASDRLDIAFRVDTSCNFVAQGTGDLSMNQWNVAFFHTKPASETGKGEPKVFLPENEPFTNRLYNCLVQWKKTLPHHPPELQKLAKALQEHQLGICLGQDLAIARLKFLPGPPFVRLPNETNEPEIREFNKILHEWIDFALYGKLVLRAGRLLGHAEVIDEFQDIRHVFFLPNLNAKISAADGGRELEKVCRVDSTEVLKDHESRELVTSWFDKRARYLFEQLQYNDVWLLEHALLSDTNLRRLACNSVISVPLTQLGAPLPWIHFILLKNGYQPVLHDYGVDVEGKFTWDWSDRSAPKLLIHLRKSYYPCTMVGIGEFGGRTAADPHADAMFLLAWGHDLIKRGSHTIWDCAEVLQKLGAEYALVLDEGQDVFQTFIANQEEKTDFVQKNLECDYVAIKKFMPVPISSRRVGVGRVEVSNRRSMRASIAFWQELEQHPHP